MHVSSLMIPFKDLEILRMSETVGDAMKHIKEIDCLSLPVCDESDVFVGILSRRYVYEQFFDEADVDREEFLNRKVSDFMKLKLPVTQDNIFLEDAAMLLQERKMNFLPIVDENTGRLKGIITSATILKQFRNLFGVAYPKLVLNVYDLKGKLAQITAIVAKAGGDIKNIVQSNLEVMGFTEITMRVDAKDIKKIIRHLTEHGIEVREYTE